MALAGITPDSPAPAPTAPLPAQTPDSPAPTPTAVPPEQTALRPAPVTEAASRAPVEQSSSPMVTDVFSSKRKQGNSAAFRELESSMVVQNAWLMRAGRQSEPLNTVRARVALMRQQHFLQGLHQARADQEAGDMRKAAQYLTGSMDAVNNGRDFEVRGVGDKLVVTAIGPGGKPIDTGLMPGQGQQPNVMAFGPDQLDSFIDRMSDPAAWGFADQKYHLESKKLDLDQKRLDEAARHNEATEEGAAEGREISRGTLGVAQQNAALAGEKWETMEPYYKAQTEAVVADTAGGGKRVTAIDKDHWKSVDDAITKKPVKNIMGEVESYESVANATAPAYQRAYIQAGVYDQVKLEYARLRKLHPGREPFDLDQAAATIVFERLGYTPEQIRELSVVK